MSDFNDNRSDGSANEDEPRLIPSSDVLAVDDLSDGSGSRVVTARGTEDGLVLRIDGRAEWEQIMNEISQFLGSRRRFLEGGQVSVEWLERLPTKEQSSGLEELLRSEYGIEISARRKRPAYTMISNGGKAGAARGGKKTKAGETVALFDSLAGSSGRADSEESSTDAGSLAARIERENRVAELEDLVSGFSHGRGHHEANERVSSRDNLTKAARERELLERELAGLSPYGDSGGRNESGHAGTSPGRGYVSNVARILGDDLSYEEDANAKVVFATLRSGQRIETPFSLIVVGDVNPGADLVAGGDIVVIGSLRGTAHAAAYDDDCQDRVVIALQMQPMQLRIGSVISRGSGEAGNGVEIARVENRRIIVETF